MRHRMRERTRIKSQSYTRGNLTDRVSNRGILFGIARTYRSAHTLRRSLDEAELLVHDRCMSNLGSSYPETPVRG